MKRSGTGSREGWGGGRLLLVLLISLMLHGTLWYARGWLEQRPETLAKPLPTLEVTLTAAGAAAGGSKGGEAETLGPPPAEPKREEAPKPLPAEPEAAPKPSPEPEKPKPRPKPKPKPKPAAKPKPEPRKAQQEKPAPREPLRERLRDEPKPESAPLNPQSSPSRNSGSPGSRQSTQGGAGGEQRFEKARANAAYLHNPRPDYPAIAKRRRWEGRVVLKVQVLAAGTAGAVSVSGSSGHAVLDEAAREAVRKWHFVPAKRGGRPVDSWVNVPINFNLQ